MNKYVKYALIVLGVLAILWTVARITNALQFYQSPSTANEPTIKYKQTFFASNLIKPERFDFICYKAELPMMGLQVVTHRLCGLPGDKIEIRNGDLFVNDENVDRRLPVMHNYRLSFEEYTRIKDKVRIVNEYWVNQFSADSVELPMSDEFVKANDVKAIRKILTTEKDEAMSQLFSGVCNQDKLGPVIVPKGKYFLLGDNRHNAQDSRYLGFIDVRNFVATVLGK